MKHQEETTCFAYRDKGCAILKEMICKEKACPFFKTEAQFQEDKKKAKERT